MRFCWSPIFRISPDILIGMAGYDDTPFPDTDGLTHDRAVRRLRPDQEALMSSSWRHGQAHVVQCVHCYRQWGGLGWVRYPFDDGESYCGSCWGHFSHLVEMSLLMLLSLFRHCPRCRTSGSFESDLCKPGLFRCSQCRRFFRLALRLVEGEEKVAEGEALPVAAAPPLFSSDDELLHLSDIPPEF